MKNNFFDSSFIFHFLHHQYALCLSFLLIAVSINICLNIGSNLLNSSGVTQVIALNMRLFFKALSNSIFIIIKNVYNTNNVLHYTHFLFRNKSNKEMKRMKTSGSREKIINSRGRKWSSWELGCIRLKSK
jgi:hypothetical protein